MRIRIQTQAPLPELKAWFVPDTPESIFGLKQALCQRLPVLTAAQCYPTNIVLMLDGFELLDDSPFDAVRDGDLIVIKSSGVFGEVQKKTLQRKRKRGEHASTSISNSVSGHWTKTVQTPAKPRASFSSSENDSSSDEDSDSSSTSSASASSSSTSSSSSSSASSSSSSSSASSSSSSSSSLSSTPPRPQPSTKKPTSTARLASSISASTSTHVPPGAGKASTHARNRRRRTKREHEKAQAEVGGSTSAIIPKGLSTTNAVPLGARGVGSGPTADPASVPLPPSPRTASKPLRKKARIEANVAGGTDTDADALLAHAKAAALAALEVAASTSASATPTPTPAPASEPGTRDHDQLMMLSMRNKNKKKGFRLSMARPIPQKIVFGDVEPSDSRSQSEALEYVDEQLEAETTEEVSQPAAEPAAPYPSQSHSHPQSRPHARLVPPSELYEQGLLPSNMIVTSVDVEAGMWDAPSRKNKKKNRKKQAQEQEEAYDEWRYEDAAEHEEDSGPMTLDYSEDTTTRTEPQPDGGAEVDWHRAEQAWEAGQPVTDVAAQFAPARVVGWKALDINPRTFSPEVLLKLARVVSVDSAQQTAVIRLLERPALPSATRAGFGFGVGMTADDEELQEETRSWADILVDSWRVLDL